MIKITRLIDSEMPQPLISEWGLSFLIEAYGRRIIFDTGASDAVVKNADAQGINLNNIDGIFLSHGHRDHTGGLLGMLKACGGTDVYAHPGIFTPRFAARPEGRTEEIGMLYSIEAIEAVGGRLNLSDKPVFIGSNVCMFGNIPLRTPFEKPDRNLLIRSDGDYVQDDFPDEIGLGVVSRDGLIVIVGCAHRGIVNTVRQASLVSGVSELSAVFGGIHLYRAPVNKVESTTDELNKMGVKSLCLCHCTGDKAKQLIGKSFKGKMMTMPSGQCIELI